MSRSSKEYAQKFGLVRTEIYLKPEHWLVLQDMAAKLRLATGEQGKHNTSKVISGLIDLYKMGQLVPRKASVGKKKSK